MHKLTLLLAMLLPAISFAQRGKQGNSTVSGANSIVNEYTSLTANAAQGATVISVAASGLNANSRFPNTLQPGDLLVIIQMQGATIDTDNSPNFGTILQYNNAGNYEWAEVKSVPSATSIELSCGLSNAYTSAGKVQVIRVPRYVNLTVATNGSITAPAWNGTTGGVVVLESNGILNLNGNNSIDVSARGFRGGSDATPSNSGYGIMDYRTPTNDFGAEKGEGIAGFLTEYDALGGRYGRGAAANGGGGGNAHNCGGGGGANGGDPAIYNGLGNPSLATANWAQAWNLEAPGFANNVSSGGGRGGHSFSDNNLNALSVGVVDPAWGGDFRRNYGGHGGRPLTYTASRAFMGGGGGGGEENIDDGGIGGKGGGIVLIRAFGNITGAGFIKANGENGGDAAGSILNGGKDGAGGGGGGGAIIVRCSGTIGNINIEARGGNGGNQDVPPLTNEAEGPGGGGGGGYVAISNSGPTVNVSGGANGTTDSAGLTEFTPNGATRGGAGTSVLSALLENLTATSDTLCEAGNAELNANLITGASYNWTNTIMGSSFGTSPALTLAVTGAQTVFLSACPLAQTITTEVVFVAPPTVNAGTDATICENQTITLAGSTDATASWEVNSTLSNTAILTPVASPTATTEYILVANNTQGCVVRDTVMISVQPQLSLTVTSDTSTCYGELLQLQAVSSGQITWSSSEFIVTPNAASTLVFPEDDAYFYAEVTEPGFCNSRDSVFVTVFSKPVVEAGPNVTICEGTTTQLNASADAPVVWSNPSLVSDPLALNPIVNPSNTVEFVITATNASGCISKDSVEVAVLPQLSLTVSANTFVCAGDTIEIQANTTGQITWSSTENIVNPNALNVLVAPTADAFFYAEVTEPGFCNSRDSVFVTVEALPLVDAGLATPICSGESVTLQGSATDAFFWANNSSLSGVDVLNPTATPTASTWYFLTAESLSGCSNTDSVLVTVSETLNILVSNDTSICAGNSVQLQVSGGTTVQWNNAALLNDASSATPLASPLTSTDFIVSVSNGGNCATTDTVRVNVFDSPSVVLSEGGLFCEEQGLELSISGIASVLWSPVDGLDNPNSLVTLAHPATATNYTANYTDVHGCVGTAGPVAITPGFVPATGFTFNQISNYVVVFEATPQAGTTVTWQMNGQTLTGDSVSYNFPFDNTYTIVQIVSNNCGSDTLTLDIEVIKQVGIEEVLNNHLALYPNPAKEKLSVSLLEKVNQDGVLRVFTMNGALVYETRTSSQVVWLETEEWSSGVYSLVWVVDEKSYRARFVR